MLEERAAAFGAPGQVAVLGGSSLAISNVSYESNASYFSVGGTAEVLYFPLRHLAVGLVGNATYSANHAYDTLGRLDFYQGSTLAARPRVGYDFPLSRWVSWFPSMSLALGSQHAQQEPTDPTASYPATLVSSDRLEAWGEVQLPLLFHPAQHFLIGFGPYVGHDFGARGNGLDQGAQETSVGTTFFVGGYFGGKPDPAAPDAASPRRFVRHMSDDGTFLFTNELEIGGGYSHRPQSDTSFGDLSLDASLDYVAYLHFTVGLSVFGSYSDSSGTDSFTQVPYHETYGKIGIRPRIGYALRFADRFVVFPRVALGFSYANDDTVLFGNVDEKSEVKLTTLSAFVPLDVEVAPHFFVGVGPAIARDLN
ncbi:MAG TPA: hypothetical protein VF407_10930, partial [Polyangiaceae bacterium]